MEEALDAVEVWDDSDDSDDSDDAVSDPGDGGRDDSAEAGSDALSATIVDCPAATVAPSGKTASRRFNALILSV